MELREFQSKVKEAFKTYERFVTRQEKLPGDENCNATMNAFNGIIQMVMDEVGSREDWESKLKVVQSFEEVVEDEYGIAKNIPIIIMRRLYERMLLKQWGADNPHDPFHKYEKK